MEEIVGLEVLNILTIGVEITEIEKRKSIGIHILIRTLDDVIILKLLVESLSEHAATTGDINLFLFHIFVLFSILKSYASNRLAK